MHSRSRIAIVNGKLLGDFDKILTEDFSFSSDPETYIYAAYQGGKWYIFHDGTRKKIQGQIIHGSLKISPNGRHFAYSIRNNNLSHMYYDNSRIGSYTDVVENSCGFDSDESFHFIEMKITGIGMMNINIIYVRPDLLVKSPKFKNRPWSPKIFSSVRLAEREVRTLDTFWYHLKTLVFRKQDFLRANQTLRLIN